VTQRGISTAFTVLTGHTADEDEFDWDAVPAAGTLVLLMGVRHLAELTRQLIAHGRAPETPAAVIQQGATPEQRVVVGTLADIAERASSIESPATTVIGEVVALREQLAWFTHEVADEHDTVAVDA
jgi:siroheme synthase